MDTLLVLTLNSGSSSLKFGLHRVDAAHCQTLLAKSIHLEGKTAALSHIVQQLADCGLPAPNAIGHRLVHGGPQLQRPCFIDAAVLSELTKARVFAPLHMPPALELIESARAHFPHAMHVACFDTSFHSNLPDVARVLPIARALQAEGVQRYGFHGLSCESIVQQLGDKLPERVVIAHLGNGASVTAVRDGRSIDTSMGLSPTGGVVMGTRSGDLDPGVLIYLMREKGFDAAMVEDLVNRRSGLLGISALSSDMRELHAAAETNTDARLAIQMFCMSVRKQIAAMASVLGGLDLLVFTGGIGENDALVRAEISAGLSHIGIRLDTNANASMARSIHASTARCRVQVIPSAEDACIARHAGSLCA